MSSLQEFRFDKMKPVFLTSFVPPVASDSINMLLSELGEASLMEKINKGILKK